MLLFVADLRIYFLPDFFSRCDNALPATDLLALLVLPSLSTFDAVDATLGLVTFFDILLKFNVYPCHRQIATLGLFIFPLGLYNLIVEFVNLSVGVRNVKFAVAQPFRMITEPIPRSK